MTGSGECRVEGASAALVEQVILDRGHRRVMNPQTHVSVELLHRGPDHNNENSSSHNNGIVGSQWKVVRRIRGRNFACLDTVTKLETDPCFAITVNVDFQNSTKASHRGAAVSITWIVKPITNTGAGAGDSPSSTCTILFIFAFVPAGVVGTVGVALCKSYFGRRFWDDLYSDAQYYAKEAIQRARVGRSNDNQQSASHEDVVDG